MYPNGCVVRYEEEE